MANNNSVEEYLVYLKENAYELRKLGKEWGMKEHEIDQCVAEALSQTKCLKNYSNSPKNMARKCWFCFLMVIKVLLILGLVLFALFGTTCVVAAYHEPTQKFVVTSLATYSYEIMRFVRLVGIPLHGIFNISSLYNVECLVENPFFVQYPPDCNICTHFKQIKGRNATNFTEEKFTAYVNTMKPLLLMNISEWNVSYRDLRRLYKDMQPGLKAEPHEFYSSVPSIQTLQDLFDVDREEMINHTESLHIRWHSSTVIGSAGLRTLFPRPPFIPSQAEIHLDKDVLIDGPNATTYRLPTDYNSPLVLFTLGSGRRRVLVRPAEGCSEYCSSMLVFMEPRQTLMFNRDMWRIYIAENGDEPSISYVISVQI